MAQELQSCCLSHAASADGGVDACTSVVSPLASIEFATVQVPDDQTHGVQVPFFGPSHPPATHEPVELHQPQPDERAHEAQSGWAIHGIGVAVEVSSDSSSPADSSSSPVSVSSSSPSCVVFVATLAALLLVVAGHWL